MNEDVNSTRLVQDFLREIEYADLPKDQQLITLVQAVAKIPWGEGRTIEDVLSTKRVGTCTGKHVLLQECFSVVGITHRMSVCCFRWSEQKILLPDELDAILEQGEWLHGHNFLQILDENNGWIDVDVTWDSALEPYGFRAFRAEWDGTTSFVGVDRIYDREDDASLERKQAWIAALSPEMRERRDRFLRGLFQWVESIRRSKK